MNPGTKDITEIKAQPATQEQATELVNTTEPPLTVVSNVATTERGPLTLDQRVENLEADNAGLNDRIDALEAQNLRIETALMALAERPSLCRAAETAEILNNVAPFGSGD